MNFADFWNNFKSLIPGLFKEAIITNIICTSSVLAESGFIIAERTERRQEKNGADFFQRL